MEAKLKEGVVLQPYGANSLIDNSNLTDEIALFLLETGRAIEEDFEALPNKKRKTN